jgi:ribosomal RNA-processing protein 12
MTTLDVCESEESVTAVVMLLGMGIKKVPSEVLKLKYAEMAKIFVNYLGKFAESDNTALLRSVSDTGETPVKCHFSELWTSKLNLKLKYHYDRNS